MDKTKPDQQSQYNEYFDRIKTSPEQQVELIMKPPLKKSGDWQYRTGYNFPFLSFINEGCCHVDKTFI